MVGSTSREAPDEKADFYSTCHDQFGDRVRGLSAKCFLQWCYVDCCRSSFLPLEPAVKIFLSLLAIGILGLVPSVAPAEDDLHPLAADVAGKLDDAERSFVMLVQLQVRPGQNAALVEAMKTPTRETTKEPGNSAYQLSQDTERPNHYVLYEVWQNVAALDSHLTQPYLVELLTAFDNVLAEPPKVTVLKPVTLK